MAERSRAVVGLLLCYFLLCVSSNAENQNNVVSNTTSSNNITAISSEGMTIITSSFGMTSTISSEIITLSSESMTLSSESMTLSSEGMTTISSSEDMTTTKSSVYMTTTTTTTPAISPINVIAHPGQDVELTCDITDGTASWFINSQGPYSVSQLFSGTVNGYNSSGNNLIIKGIVINDLRNRTEYQCAIDTANPNTHANPIFLYVAATTATSSIASIMTSTVIPTITSAMSLSFTSMKTSTISTSMPSMHTSTVIPTVTPTVYSERVPAVIPHVTVDNNTININGNNVTLTLSWEEPFNNFDPIVNYTVSCLGDVTCPPNFTTTDNTTRSYTITNLITMTNYTFSVVATNSIGSGEAGVVMITTPPVQINDDDDDNGNDNDKDDDNDDDANGDSDDADNDNADNDDNDNADNDNDNDDDDIDDNDIDNADNDNDDNDNDYNHIDANDDDDDNDGDSLAIIFIVIFIIVVIICFCGCMDILFCYFCKRKEKDYQHEDDRIINISIIVFGIFTCGTSVLLWWLFKGLLKYVSEDKHDIEDPSTNSKKSSKSSNGKRMQSLSNGLTEDDKLRTITNSPSNEESNAVTAKALSEETFIDPLPHYDYAAVGMKKVVGINHTAATGAQQAVSTKIDQLSSEITADGAQYALCNVVPKDKKGDQEEKIDIKQWQPQGAMEYAVVDKSKKAKKKDDKQNVKVNSQQQQPQGAMEYAVVDKNKKKNDKQRDEKLDSKQWQPQGAMEYAVVDKNKKTKKKDDQQKEKMDSQQQQQQGAMEYAVVDTSKKKKKGNEQQNGNAGIQQPQPLPGKEFKEEMYAGHKQKTELNYMNPNNLEFKKQPFNRMDRFGDHTVQYQEVAAKQNYTSIL